MKVVTEFANFTLTKALQAKAALAGEGKSPEEVQQNLGETFKLEGDKLGYFMNALDVAEKNSQGLKRVLVMSLNEGEKAPSKAAKVDEMYYVPEMHIDPKAQQAKKADGKEGRGGRGGKRGGKPGDKRGGSRDGGREGAKGAGREGGKPSKPN